jgi:hypothetical protein
MAIFQADLNVEVAYDALSVTFIDNSNYSNTTAPVVSLPANITSRIVSVFRLEDTVTAWKTYTFTGSNLTVTGTGAQNLPSGAYRIEFDIVTTGVTLDYTQKRDYGVYPINVSEKAAYLSKILAIKDSPSLRTSKDYINNLCIFSSELDLSDYMAELGDQQSCQDALDRINNYVLNLF